MKNSKRVLVISLLFLLLSANLFAQQSSHSVTIDILVDKKISESFKQKGRLYVFFSLDSIREPRTQTWPNPTNKTFIFAKNIDNLDPKKPYQIKNDNEWIGTPNWTLANVPHGEYFVQLLWDQQSDESRIDEPGNYFTLKKKIKVNAAQKLSFLFDQQIQNRTIEEHPLSRYVELKSDTLSKWWGKSVSLKASILLPKNYSNKKEYPISYSVAGYGGRYDRINKLLTNKAFNEWWVSNEAPEIITVFLDGEGPFGDSYQLDSENSGPYGHALINELIPHIEGQYRGTQSSKHRFVEGCSTGGWVSLALQLYYPDFFDGVFSYSPDAIAFENYQLINIYKDDNAFTNEFGYERPVMRNGSGEPMLSLREFIQYENVLGTSNTYLNSGGQFSAHTALYSPKGKNNLPKPLFHPTTGVIDSTVAEHWKKYDLKLYAKQNWSQLGPKVQGKIYIWMGDMDQFYLNTGTREFDAFLKTTENPVSDADVEFTPMEGHCSNYSYRKVLLKIKERLEKGK